MAKRAGYSKQIWVYTDWIELGGAVLMGTLAAGQIRGREVFSFSYSKEWLKNGPALVLDPELGLYTGHSIAMMISLTSDSFSIPHPTVGVGF